MGPDLTGSSIPMNPFTMVEDEMIFCFIWFFRVVDVMFQCKCVPLKVGVIFRNRFFLLDLDG